MRKLIPLLFALVLFTGCDFFRMLAGRPTSADIERKRDILEAEMADHQARLEARRIVEKRIADSLEAVDAIRQSNDILLRSGSLDGIQASALQKRFYIMIGTFSNRSNAEKLAGRAESRSYPVTLINYRNGFTAVGLCGSDNLVEVYDKLQSVRKEIFCPSDVWVLEND